MNPWMRAHGVLCQARVAIAPQYMRGTVDFDKKKMRLGLYLELEDLERRMRAAGDDPCSIILEVAMLALYQLLRESDREVLRLRDDEANRRNAEGGTE